MSLNPGRGTHSGTIVPSVELSVLGLESGQ